MVVAAAIGTSPTQSLPHLGSVSGRTSHCSFDFAAESSSRCRVLSNSFGKCLSCKQYQSVHKRDLMLSYLPKKTAVSFAERASSNAKHAGSLHAWVPPFAAFSLASAISIQGQSQCSRDDQWAADWWGLNRTGLCYKARHDVQMCKSYERKKLSQNRALLEGSGHADSADLQAQDGLNLSSKSETSSKSLEVHTKDVLNTDTKSDSSRKHAGRSGIVSFYDVQVSDAVEADHERQSNKKWWIFSLWLLGPTALVSSVVLPPFCLRKLFEVLLEDSLVTDFLILFFTEALFYVGVAIFLFIAHTVQKCGGVVTWKSASHVNLAYKVSSVATTALGILLPVVAFAVVWPWTGPAAAAALCPYIAGLAVQYGFEQFIREKKSFVWPLVPIVFQVYRLHQLNRATQLVAGLLYSLKGADATAESLAVNGSLQTLVSVLQLLGMLCLWSLAAFLTYVFCSESQSWESKLLASEQT